MTSGRPRCPQSWGPRCSFIEPHRAATPPFCPRLAPFLALPLILNARGKDSQEDSAHSCHYAWRSASAITGPSHLLFSCHTSCPESHWLAHFLALGCAHVILTSTPPSQQPCLPLSLRDKVGYGGPSRNTSVTLCDEEQQCPISGQAEETLKRSCLEIPDWVWWCTCNPSIWEVSPGGVIRRLMSSPATQ